MYDPNDNDRDGALTRTHHPLSDNGDQIPVD